MSAIVLCDGEAASQKCIEIGGVAPGLFMRNHSTEEELILLHVWSVVNQVSMTAALNANRDAEELEQSSSAEIKITPELVHTVSSDMTEKKRAMEHVAKVVQRALSVINEHKLLKNSLLYSIETTRKEMQPTIFTCAKDKNSNDDYETQERAHDNNEQEYNAELNDIDKLKKTIANAVIHHVRERAMYYEHKTNRKPAILCGVGNNVEGRSVQVGSVAHALWSNARHEYELCFVKADGCSWKPRATCIRYMVVIPVLMKREFHEEEEEKEEYQQNETSTVKKGENKNDDDNDNNNRNNCLSSSLQLIEQTLHRRRAKSNDFVSVLLLVEQENHKTIVEQFTKDITNLLADNHKAQNTIIENDNNKYTKDEESINEPLESDVQEINKVEQEINNGVVPFVQVAYLKGNKSNNNHATFDNSPGQLTKLLHQHCKCEFVIVDAQANKQVQLALLTLTKPHCIITRCNTCSKQQVQEFFQEETKSA